MLTPCNHDENPDGILPLKSRMSRTNPSPRYFRVFSPIFLGLFSSPMNGGLPEFNNLGTAPSLGLGGFGLVLPLVPRQRIGALIHTLTLFEQKSRMIRGIILKGKIQERDLVGHICGTFYRLRVELYVLLAIYNLL